MNSIQYRLIRLRKKYCFTTTDLSVLMGVSRGTVFSWERGVMPALSKVPQIEAAIKKIEHAGESKEAPYPVPLSVSQFERKDYLLGSLNVGNFRVSKPRASAKRGGS